MICAILLLFLNDSLQLTKTTRAFFIPSIRRRAARAGAARAGAAKPKLSASFLDEIQTNFNNFLSSMTGGEQPTGQSGKSNSVVESPSPYYTVAITGASGLVGTALIDELQKKNNGMLNGKPIRIVRLVRSDNVTGEILNGETTMSYTLPWNPKAEGGGDSGSSNSPVIDRDALESIDTIVHLAGESVATGLGPLGFLPIRPWTNAKKEEIVNSRVGPTKALAEAISASSRPKTFIVASGIGVYGDNYFAEEEGDAPSLSPADEYSNVDSTPGFLADVSRAWEAATAPATSKNRVVNLRLGVVLSRFGGASARLRPIFLAGGGGNVGSGKQYFSYISARDVARAIVHIMETPSLSGPVNACAPNPCTNAEFTAAFGKVLSRPTILPFPGFAVNLLFGEMGNEMLLGGTRAVPKKLLNSGFQFQHPTIEKALESAMSENI